MMKVAIIGGGCAGLGAAELLLEKKQNVVLIEAYARLGGRAFTDTSQKFPFDVGPQFIQDPAENPWSRIAKTLGFKTTPRPQDFKTFYRVQLDSVWQDIGELNEPEEMQKYLNALKEGYEAAEDTANLPAITQSFGPEQYAQLALASSSYGSIAESAEPWQYIVSDNARQVDGSGGVLYVDNGLGTLVAAFGEELAEQYPDNFGIRLSTVVTRIHSAENRCDIYAGDELVCQADYCIVTVPCSALPQIAFIPPLSYRRVVANGYVMLGSYKKVAFCPKRMPDGLAENAEYYLYDSNLEACWQYFRLPTAPQALIGVASGNFARRLDRMEDEVAAAYFISALKAAYPLQEIAPTQDPLVTNWSNQPHVWGAYSYTRYDGGDPDDPTPYTARDEIGKPHAGGRVQFAGEATWTKAYGTIHGAYRSGRRAAKTILAENGLLV